MTSSSIVRICHKGYLRPDWSEWFDGMTITHDEDHQTTVVEGPVRDQAALGALLNTVFALGVARMSVTPIQANEAVWGA